MTEQVPSFSRHDLEAKIVKHCWEDEEFRKEFTADPAGAFVKYLQIPAAGLPRISVHQEEPGAWHIVLPAKPADAAELAEVDLETIAGGGSAGIALSALDAAAELIFLSGVKAAPAVSPAVTAAVSGGVVAGAGVVSGIISAAADW